MRERERERDIYIYLLFIVSSELLTVGCVTGASWDWTGRFTTPVASSLTRELLRMCFNVLTRRYGV